MDGINKTEPDWIEELVRHSVNEFCSNPVSTRDFWDGLFAQARSEFEASRVLLRASLAAESVGVDGADKELDRSAEGIRSAGLLAAVAQLGVQVTDLHENVGAALDDLRKRQR